MTFITITCDCCGPVDLGVDRVVLEDSGSAQICRMRCPNCGMKAERVLNDSMTALLRAVGVSPVVTPRSVMSVASEVIDEAELAEFRQRLSSTDDLIRWMAVEPSEAIDL